MENLNSSGVKARECLSRIILRTPDGQIDAVVNLLMLLLKEQDLRDWLLKALSQYNKNHMLTCKSEGFERPSVITKFNEVKDEYFCDPVNRRLFKFDHKSKIIVSSTLWVSNDESEPWRQAIDGVFFHYVQSNFGNGNCGVFGASQNGTIAITVCIINRLHNPQNFYSSCWRSIWILVVTPELPQALLKGSVQVEACYAENGNAFMTSEKTLDTHIRLQDKSNTASEMLKIVKDFEEEFHQSVLDTYRYISESALKMFRRRIPINKVSMNWNIRITKEDLKFGNTGFFTHTIAECQN